MLWNLFLTSRFRVQKLISDDFTGAHWFSQVQTHLMPQNRHQNFALINKVVNNANKILVLFNENVLLKMCSNVET